MAPFRSSARTSRNANPRSAIDHDVFEGLPIRQWRLSSTSIAPPSAPQPQDKGALPELPMPRDYQLLPEVSQQLLRAARSGRLWKPPTPPHEDDKDGDEDEGEKDEQKGFHAKKWTVVPRHAEEPEREFLAKRRKGLPSLHQITVQTHHPPPPPPRKSKSRRAEPQQQQQPPQQQQEVTIPTIELPPSEGQPAETENGVESTTAEATPTLVVPEAGTEGVSTAITGLAASGDVAVAPITPQKRRAPSSKRKSKKSSSKSKKKVMFSEERKAAAAVNGEAPTIESEANGDVSTAAGENGIPKERADTDTPMADAHDDSSEGEDHDDEDREDGELSDEEGTPNKIAISTPTPVPIKLEAADPPGILSPGKLAPPQGKKRARDPSSSPETPLVSISHSRSGSLQSATLPTDISQLPPSVSEPSTEGLADVEMEDSVEPAATKNEPANEPPAELLLGEPSEDIVETAVEMDIDPIPTAQPEEPPALTIVAEPEEPTEPAQPVEPAENTETLAIVEPTTAQTDVPVELEEPALVEAVVTSAPLEGALSLEPATLAQPEQQEVVPEEPVQPIESIQADLPEPHLAAGVVESLEQGEPMESDDIVPQAVEPDQPVPIELAAAVLQEPLLPIAAEEPEKPAEVIEAALPEEPIQASEAMESAEPAASTEAPVTTEPDQSDSMDIEPIEPAQSVEIVETAEPIESVQPVQSAEIAETAEPVESIETAQPAEPAETTEAAKPIETIEPVETAESAEPAEPVATVEPAKAAEAVEAVDAAAEATAEVVKSVESIEPIEPMEVATAEPVIAEMAEEVVEAPPAIEVKESTEAKEESKPEEPAAEAQADAANTTDEKKDEVTFPDGEVDLFGSLEAHLDKESTN